MEVTVPPQHRFGPVTGMRVRQAGLRAEEVLAVGGQPGQLGRDRRRLNGLVAAGWRVPHVTAADLYRPEEVIARVRGLLDAEIGGTGR